MTLSWRPAALMTLGIIPAVILGSWLTVILWTVLVLAAILVDLVLAASPRSLTIERTVARSVRLSQKTESVLAVRNESKRFARGELRDAWQPSAGPSKTIHKIAIAPGSATRLRTTLVPTRRGDRTAEHLTLRLFGPLGCAARQLTLDAGSKLRVLPEFKSRQHLPSRLARLREMDGQSAVQLRGAGTEFDSLRPYVEGDDVRSIDWRATARAQEVTIRTWRPERDRRVVVVVDTSRTSAPRIGDEPRLDSFIEAALLMGALTSAAGDRVDLLAFDRTSRAQVSGKSGPELMSAFAHATSGLEPALVEADWGALIARVKKMVSQRALIVLLTNCDLTATDVGLLPVIGSLTKDHVVVLGRVIDPDTAQLAKTRNSSAEVYDAAAAERETLDLLAAQDLLKRAGVYVTARLPNELAPALADTYLDLKATGRL